MAVHFACRDWKLSISITEEAKVVVNTCRATHVFVFLV